jgi:hypothetical protein
VFLNNVAKVTREGMAAAMAADRQIIFITFVLVVHVAFSIPGTQKLPAGPGCLPRQGVLPAQMGQAR